MEQNKTFKNVHLSFNLADLGNTSECNPGGSTFCTAGTKGCDAGMTCVGTSSTDGLMDPTIFESNLRLDEKQFQHLSRELQRVIKEFAH